MSEGRKEYAIYVITKHGLELARRIRESLPQADLYVSSKLIASAPAGSIELPLPMGPTLTKTFGSYYCHVHIISVGAVVRMIKDLLEDKKKDPAIICVDDAGKFSICVLSGHVGRGNIFAQKVAEAIGATPVITTASDVRGTLTVDILGRDFGWQLDDADRNVTRGCAAVVNETRVAFVQEAGEPDFWQRDAALPPGVEYYTSLDEVNPADFEILLIATDREIKKTHPAHWENSVIYRPKTLVLGIGCDKETPFEIIERGVLAGLLDAKLSPHSVKTIASIDIKKDEPGILRLADKYGWDFVTYPADVLDATEGIETPSDVVKKHTGSRGVAEPACLRAAGAKKLLVAKRSYKEAEDPHNMTMAVARLEFSKRDVSGGIR